MHLRGATAVATVLLASWALQGRAAGQHAAHHAVHSAAATASAQDAAAVPTEPGQSAFAAIAEIVEILTSDPLTDWSTVDIDALRRHLVDMNELTLNAAVETSLLPDGISFRVTGEGRTLRAITAMVPAHAAMLSAATAWQVEVETIDDGALMTVRAESPAERVKLEGLGFFGVMVTGAHHQAHHLQMARGGGHAH